MFGSSNGTTPPVTGGRPAASQVARIENNLTHVLVGGGSGPDNVHIFLNAQPIVQGELESLSINIIAPTDEQGRGTLTGLLSRYTGEGEARTQRATSLFPGTVEIIAAKRRIVVTCQEDGSFDGLWLGLGLNADGTSSDLTGVKSLQIVVTPTVVDAKLVWSEDGATENILP